MCILVRKKKKDIFNKSSISQRFDTEEEGGFALSGAVHSDLRAELKSLFYFSGKIVLADRKVMTV